MVDTGLAVDAVLRWDGGRGTGMAFFSGDRCNPTWCIGGRHPLHCVRNRHARMVAAVAERAVWDSAVVGDVTGRVELPDDRFATPGCRGDCSPARAHDRREGTA